MRVAIFTDFNGWHEKKLRQAFAQRSVEAVFLSLKSCQIGGGSDCCFGLQLPGFERSLPDAVFVRYVPGGSFEQVTFRLDILHALSDCGVPVYNSARIIEKTVDKAMTSFLLAKAGVANVPTWSCESRKQAAEIVHQALIQGHKMVLKPLFGSRGNGLRLLETVEHLPAEQDWQGVYYLQRFIEPAADGARDWRVFVVGGCAIAAMERRSSHWITNRARGGKCLPTLLDADLAQPAIQATAAVGAYYAGVDLICDEQNQYCVIEVNGIPAWQGLQSVSANDLAQHLVDDLLHQIPDCAVEAVS